MKISCSVDPKHPEVLAATRFKEIVEKETGGDVEVVVYPSSQLGAGVEVIQATQAGTIEANMEATSKQSNFVPEYAVLDLPYLVTSLEEAYELLDGPIGDELIKVSIEKGIRPLGFWEASVRNIYTAKRKINSIDDLKGLKIRVIPSPSFVELFNALGASPTPMPFGEIFTSLKQGVIDAAENDSLTYFQTKHYEAAPNLAITNHIFLTATLNVSEVFWQKLPEEYREIMMAAADEAKNFLREMRAKDEADVIQKLRDAGVSITKPDLQPFVSRARSIYPKFKDKVGDVLYNQVMDYLEN